MCTAIGGIPGESRDAFLKRLGELNEETARQLAEEVRKTLSTGSGSFPSLKTLLSREIGEDIVEEGIEEGTIRIRPGDLQRLTELFANDNDK